MTVTEVARVRAVISLVPTGFGPNLLCGELRTDDDRPIPHTLFVAPATERGRALLTARLTLLANDTADTPGRNLAIRTLRECGATLSEIAEQFHISVSHVSRLCRRAS